MEDYDDERYEADEGLPAVPAILVIGMLLMAMLLAAFCILGISV